MTSPRSGHRAGPADSGSATVEAVGLMIPSIGACILLLVFGLHLAAAGQALTAAAAAAARAASLQPTSSSALAAARAETDANLGLNDAANDGHGCTRTQVGLDAGAFRPGGTAVVSLTCTLSVGALTGVGIPGQLTRTVTSRAPIDLYSAPSAQGS
jgi:hypothetical protein